MASPSVGPLTRAITGPSCMPLERSHSQALSRAGRPKVVRKPLGSSTPESGRAAARVPGNAGELRHRAGHPVDRVQQDFGRQPPGGRVRVVDLVVGVPRVGLDRELVRPRVQISAHEVPDVEAALDELVGQVVEQFGIGRRVAGADVVERLDDPDAEQIAPEPIDVALGEIRVVLRRSTMRPARPPRDVAAGL